MEIQPKKEPLKIIPEPNFQTTDVWTKSALEAWYIVCEALQARGHLKEEVLHLVAMYCDNLTIYDKLTYILLHSDEFKKKDRDSERKSVVFMERVSIQNAIRDLEKRLGISPYSSTRIKDIEVAPEDDPFDNF